MAERIVVVAQLQDELSRGLRTIQSEVRATAAGVKAAGASAAGAAGGWTSAGSAMSRVGASFAALGPKLDAAQQKMATFSNTYNKALDKRTTMQTDMAGLALVGAFAAAAFASMRFEKQMSQTQAVTNASAEEMDSLRESALEAGQATQFSATDAAQAQSELAKAGLTVADITGGALKGSLDLAAAGGLDLARAAEISATSMNMFGLEASDVTMIADTFAAGANKSAADVEGLSQSLTMVGQVAASTGLTLQDTVTGLAMFADEGLKGSDAGTSFKTMLMRLNPSTKEASAKMQELGLDFYDATGKFVGMGEVANQLQSKLGGLSDEARNSALATMFGTDAVRAANILVKKGAAGWAEYSAAMNDAGAASRMAAIMTDNLAGDMERLGGAFETLLIKSGSGSNDALRGVAKGATFAVDQVGKLPDQLLGLGTIVTGLAGAWMLLGPRVAAAGEAFAKLAESSPKVAGAITSIAKMGGALLIVVGGAASFLKGIDMVTDKLGEMTGWVDQFEAVKQAIVGLTPGLGPMIQFGDAISAAFDSIGIDSGILGRLPGLFDLLTGNTDGFNAANEELAAIGGAASASLTAEAAAVADLNGELATTAGWLSQQDALMNYQAALDDARASAKENGKTLTMNTEAGRANRQSLLGIANAARQAFTITDENGKSTVTNTGAYKKSAVAFYEQARAMGKSVQGALRLTKSAFGAETALQALDSTKVSPKIEAKTDALKRDISDSKRRLNRLQKEKTSPKVDAKIERLKNKIADGRASLRRLDRQNTSPKVQADIRRLKSKLADAKADLRRLEKKPTSPKVDAKIDAAKQRISTIEKDLSAVDRKNTKPVIDANNAPAMGAIGEVQRALAGLQDKTVTLTTVHKDVKGDTASSHALGGPVSLAATVSRHYAIAGSLGGGYRITNLLTGGGGRGRGSGDHQAGRAVDVQGPRLGAYVQAVRASGGFAELHGSGAGRHAHAVLGDTASPRSGSGGGGSDTVTIGPFYFTGVSKQDEAAIKSTVRAGVREYMNQRKHRGV